MDTEYEDGTWELQHAWCNCDMNEFNRMHQHTGRYIRQMELIDFLRAHLQDFLEYV